MQSLWIYEFENHYIMNSTPTWNEEFELPDGSYSMSDIYYYFECILKNHGEKQLIFQ